MEGGNIPTGSFWGLKVKIRRKKPVRPNFIVRNRVEFDEWASPVFVVCVVGAIFLGACIQYRANFMAELYARQREQLAAVREMEHRIVIEEEEAARLKAEAENETFEPVYTENGDIDLLRSHVQTMDDAPMKPDMKDLYDVNPDTAGWLKIGDTVIDYPVMQTPEDEEYYLNRDFNGDYSAYGCLIMDTDSQIGSGTKEMEYADGSIPCTNLIIHGHNMKNGSMFGSLDNYKDQSYCNKHRIIKFSSLTEDREYEVMSVFLSQVFLKTQTDVFKYYQFFQANTEKEFDNFYDNVKNMSLYDTGVTAEFGDEFITLSVCAYHVENGRLVVVGKRIK